MQPHSSIRSASKRCRVVQWATGNVGSRALKCAIEHPDLDLVGVYVYNPAKVGMDAGDLCGLSPVGVKATNRVEDILALKPDCVLHMSHVFDPEEICRILEAGCNVVTTRMELQNPWALDPAMAKRIEQACATGSSSIHATGSSPGFITEAIPIVLGSIQRKLRHLAIREFADVSMRNSPEMIFDMMGFGKAPGPVETTHLDHALMSFAPSLQLVATAFGLPVERFETRGAFATARVDEKIAAGIVPRGTVAATRATVAGVRQGRELISFTSTWFVSTNVDTSDGNEWEFRSPSGWHLLVDGDMPLDLSISFPIEDGEYANVIPGLTAHRPINAVPYICDAPPGIQTTTDLPQVVAHLTTFDR